jgi:adenylate kinase
MEAAMNKKVIYLTGAPASGKTTTVQKLLQMRTDIELWNYSQRLIDYINDYQSKELTHDALRRASAAIVRPQDVTAVDTMLIDFVSRSRAEKHIIIDSHPATREDYGFRCTPFSETQICAISPDEIWVLYTDPETTIERIGSDPHGRKTVDVEHARMHTFLQASIATNYGIAAGKPVYFFDSTADQEQLAGRLARRLS